MATSFLEELLQSPDDTNPPLDGQKVTFTAIPPHQQGTNMAQGLSTTQIGPNPMLVTQHVNDIPSAGNVPLSSNPAEEAASSTMLTRVLSRSAGIAPAVGVARQPVPIAPRPAAVQLRPSGSVAVAAAAVAQQQQQRLVVPSGGANSIPVNGQPGNTGAVVAAQSQQQQQQQQQEQPSDKVKKFLNNLVLLANKTSPESGAMVTDLVKQLVSGSLSEEVFVQRMGESQSGSTVELLSLLKSGVPQLRNELKALDERNRQQQLQQINSQPQVTSVPQTATLPQSQSNQIVQSTLQQQPQQQQSQYVHIKTTTGQVVAVPAQLYQQLQQQQKQQIVVQNQSETQPQPQPQPQQQQQQQQQQIIVQPVYSSSSLQQSQSVAVMQQPATLQQAASVGAASPKTAVSPRQTPSKKSAVSSTPSKAAVGGTKGKQKASGGIAGAGSAGGGGGGGPGEVGPVRMEDDDITDVTSMAGVNLMEETARISATNSELVTGATRSIKEDLFLVQDQTEKFLKETLPGRGIDSMSPDVSTVLSHAVEEYLKDLIEKLAAISQHRQEIHKDEQCSEVVSDTKANLKVFERIDQFNAKKKQERERELLMKAAKSRSKQDDAELAFLKEKAKQMQQEEDEILRKRAANETALMAIGSRKRPKIDLQAAADAAQFGRLDGSDADALTNPNNPGGVALARAQARKTRLRRVNFKDLLFLLEQERQTRKSLLLYKSYLK